MINVQGLAGCRLVEKGSSNEKDVVSRTRLQLPRSSSYIPLCLYSDVELAVSLR